MASWNDFLFGSKESRAKSKQVLKEMRPTYERPKLGGRKSVSAPKNPNAGIGVAAKRNPTPKNPNAGIGKDQSRVPRKDQSRIKPEPSPGAIDIRGYFGDERTGVRKPVASFAAKPKQVASPPVKPAAVVSTTVDMKTSPVKTAPIKTAVSPKETSMSRAQRIVAERQAAGPRMAGGKNVSYGFGNAKALGQSIAKSFGGGGQRSGGGMGGGMRSGGGRATDPSRGGMGNSGRGTGSKK